MDNHIKGLLIVAIGVFSLSFDALLVRLAETSTWNIVFWRGIFIFSVLSIILLVKGARGQVIDIKPYPIVIIMGCIGGVGLILFPLSLNYTSTANTVVILTATPLFAALLSRVFLKERIQIRTWVAIIVVFLGILVIFSGSISGNGIFGDLIALLAAVNFGLNMTLLRSFPNISRISIICLSGLIAAILCFPLAQPLELTSQSYQVLAISGLVQMPAAMVLIAIGTRYLPAAEVSLLILIEAVLAPLWVWLFLWEIPDENTFYGGGIILLTLLAHSWISLRTNKKT